MVNPMNPNERLAALEAKLEYLKETLSDIHSDLKVLPSSDDIEYLEETDKKLDDRVGKLETAYLSLAVKIAATAGIVSLLAQFLIYYFTKKV
jgi:hypothetical protein